MLIILSFLSLFVSILINLRFLNKFFGNSLNTKNIFSKDTLKSLLTSINKYVEINNGKTIILSNWLVPSKLPFNTFKTKLLIIIRTIGMISK